MLKPLIYTYLCIVFPIFTVSIVSLLERTTMIYGTVPRGRKNSSPVGNKVKWRRIFIVVRERGWKTRINVWPLSWHGHNEALSIPHGRFVWLLLQSFEAPCDISKSVKFMWDGVFSRVVSLLLSGIVCSLFISTFFPRYDLVFKFVFILYFRQYIVSWKLQTVILFRWEKYGL